MTGALQSICACSVFSNTRYMLYRLSVLPNLVETRTYELTNKTISSATVANAYTIQHCVCAVFRAVRAFEYYCTVRYGDGAPKKPN